MENPNYFNQDYKPQAIVLNNNESAQNGKPKNIITEFVNDINMLKIAVGELLNKDKTTTKYEDLFIRNSKKISDLTEKMENCKNLVKLLETANFNLNSENKQLKAEIKQKDERIKELKKINKIILKKYEDNILKKENEKLHEQLSNKQKEVDFLK